VFICKRLFVFFRPTVVLLILLLAFMAGILINLLTQMH